MKASTNFSGLVQAFFTDRLLRQRKASPHTVAGYRDTFRLFLRFAAGRLGKVPSRLALEELDAPFIGEFLDHLEKERGVAAESQHAAGGDPFLLPVRVVPGAGPRRPVPPHPRHPQQTLRAETDRAPQAGGDRRAAGGAGSGDVDRSAGPGPAADGDPDGAEGVRTDRLAARRCRPRHRCARPLRGQGQEKRCTPLGQDVVAVLANWFRECPAEPAAPAFPSSRGGPLSRDAVERLVARHQRSAEDRCPSLKRKRVTPHVLRHTAAMQLLRHGIDRSVIAPVAGARVGGDDRDVSPCRPAAEGRGARQGTAVKPAAGAVPAGRRAAGLPGGPLIMPHQAVNGLR